MDKIIERAQEMANRDRGSLVDQYEFHLREAVAEHTADLQAELAAAKARIAELKARPPLTVDLSDEAVDSWLDAGWPHRSENARARMAVRNFAAHLRSTAKPAEQPVRDVEAELRESLGRLKDKANANTMHLKFFSDGSWGVYCQNADLPVLASIHYSKGIPAAIAAINALAQPKEPTAEEDCNTISRIPGPMTAEDSIEFSLALNRIRERLKALKANGDQRCP